MLSVFFWLLFVHTHNFYTIFFTAKNEKSKSSHRRSFYTVFLEKKSLSSFVVLVVVLIIFIVYVVLHIVHCIFVALVIVYNKYNNSGRLLGGTLSDQSQQKAIATTETTRTQ